MSKPASPAEFGTVVPSAPVAPTRRRTHARFHDVNLYAAKAMPQVKVGQVYEDLDPRCQGRRIQVLKIGGDGKVMVRTIANRLCEPRTPSKTQRATIGDISFIALRRFRENSRGFRLLRGTPKRAIESYFLAARLADICDISVSEVEVRVADALIGLLGKTGAHEYLDLISQDDGMVARDLYLSGGIADLLADAAMTADETDLTYGWLQTEVASRATARTVARHA